MLYVNLSLKKEKKIFTDRILLETFSFKQNFSKKNFFQKYKATKMSDIPSFA